MSKRRFKNDDYEEGYYQALSDLQSKMPKEKRETPLDSIVVDQNIGFNECLAELNTIIEEMKNE